MKKKIFPSTQLIMLLHPKVLKVYLYLLAWMLNDVVYIYQKQLSKATKLSEKEVEIAVQTLIDNKLIEVKHNDLYEVTFNVEEANKYYKMPLKEAIEMELLPISTEITWNKETKQKTDSIENMSDEEIRTLLLRLQARLKEKEEVKKIVKTSNTDDLPF